MRNVGQINAVVSELIIELFTNKKFFIELVPGRSLCSSASLFLSAQTSFSEIPSNAIWSVIPLVKPVENFVMICYTTSHTSQNTTYNTSEKLNDCFMPHAKNHAQCMHSGKQLWLNGNYWKTISNYPSSPIMNATKGSVGQDWLTDGATVAIISCF